jgi:hypothetical protein
MQIGTASALNMFVGPRPKVVRALRPRDCVARLVEARIGCFDQLFAGEPQPFLKRLEKKDDERT